MGTSAKRRGNGSGNRRGRSRRKATVPAFDPTSADATRLDEQLKTAMADDLRPEFVKQLQQELGVTVNPQALRNAFGGASTAN